jgi:tetratricopeptide (TPR) repeat protein
MSSKSIKTIVSVVIIVFGYAAVFGLSGFIENRRPAMPAGFEDEDLALHGARLKGYSLGAEGLIADWYWMKSLQYIGDKILNSKEDVSLDDMKSLNPRLLYPYLDNATTLDPRFVEAYSYGAVVLPAIDKDLAVKIAQKGIENNPEQWRLYHELGYIYWKLENYEKSAEIYADGAKIKDAPPFMKMMAAKMKTEGGSRTVAREIYSQMLEQAKDENTKKTAELRLMELDSLDERDAINKMLQIFQQKTGRCPNSFTEIFPLLKSVKLPSGKDFRLDNSNNLIDPTDAPYVLDKEKCEAKLDLEKTKIPLR